MAVKQVNKWIKKVNVPISFPPKKKIEKKEEKKEEVVVSTKKNKQTKKDSDMTLNEIEKAENLVQNMTNPKVKIVKKEKGLIERTETEKVVLTEDNRQVLND